jgi:hypothetical protein
VKQFTSEGKNTLCQYLKRLITAVTSYYILCVHIGHDPSACYYKESRVMQGSILRVNLFVVIISGMIIIGLCISTLFYDHDITIYCSSWSIGCVEASWILSRSSFLTFGNIPGPYWFA